MRILAITGPFGAGKTSVTHLLAQELEKAGECVQTIALDEVAHSVVDGDANLRHRLADTFGPAILRDDSSLDRAALADRAFADNQATARLNALVHPPTVERARVLLAEAGKMGATAILEAPFPLAYMTELSEQHDHHHLDIWTVTAPTDVRLRRALADGYSEMDALRRMERQPSADAYRSEAAVHIENDGTRKDLLDRVKRCLKKSDWLKTN